MKIVATTPRLSMREFCESDAAGFFELNQDPEVVKYTGDDPFADVDAASDFIRQYDQYQLYGFGRWALYFEREFIGFCGLKQHVSGEVDLGFRLMRRHWGKGLASEAAQASLVLGHDKFGLSKLISRAMTDNLASCHLLGKLGFSHRPSLDAPPWQGFELELNSAPAAANLAAWRATVNLLP
ncbi:GNAT family N-acetyltransferase [Shewanella khirikhana]|uniref:GNAT family N-acetyltransferase n=1 Tax=Shewanella khirikhana TaxID=1965282 RepID=UPI0030D34046